MAMVASAVANGGKLDEARSPTVIDRDGRTVDPHRPRRCRR
jgi:hypothetical protein